MRQGGRGRGAVISGTATISELRPVEGAAASGATREAVLLRGANAVGRRRRGGTPRRGAATET